MQNLARKKMVGLEGGKVCKHGWVFSFMWDGNKTHSFNKFQIIVHLKASFFMCFLDINQGGSL